MKNTLSNKLNQELAHLSADQIESLIKQAQHMKQRSGKKGGTLDEWVRRALSRAERQIRKATDRQEGIVASVVARDVLLEVGDELVHTPLGGVQVVVGDRVTVGLLDGELTILEVHERRTKLSRPDVNNANQEQLIVANVDVVVIVVSVVSPPLHPRLIDRYLVAIQNGGAEAALCVNKIDLLQDRSELEKLEPYRRLGIPTFECSTLQGRGIQEVRSHLAGRVVAFVGHSGVGKSSLANAITPELGLKTGGISEGCGRGTHTTTTSSLHRLEDGTTLIDTPGIRSFGLWDSGQEEITASFHEFAQYTCRFRNCRHLTEPDCGVIKAVEQGEISQERYDTYCRMLEEAN